MPRISWQLSIPGALFLILALWALWVFLQFTRPQNDSYVSDEAGFDAVLPISKEVAIGVNGRYSARQLESWKRIEGPARVGIQVGHLDSNDVPEELAGLRANGAGAQANGTTERDAMHTIALLLEKRLQEEGVVVDVLPATIPVGYIADAFISLHADGNSSPSVSGFKIAHPRRDYSEASDELEVVLYRTYGGTTKLPIDPNVTRRMRGYYAFNWYRYEHAIHPMTPSVILETGFITSPNDRAIIIDSPEVATEGIALGVVEFLTFRGVL